MTANTELKLMDRPSHDSSDQRRSDADTASLKAAKIAVDEIYSDIENLGGTREQTRAVVEAIRFGLLRDFKKSKEYLLEIGLDEEFVDDFVSDLERKVKTDS